MYKLKLQISRATKDNFEAPNILKHLATVITCGLSITKKKLTQPNFKSVCNVNTTQQF